MEDQSILLQRLPKRRISIKLDWDEAQIFLLYIQATREKIYPLTRKLTNQLIKDIRGKYARVRTK